MRIHELGVHDRPKDGFDLLTSFLRKWLDASLLLIPICLIGLFLSTSIYHPGDDARTALDVAFDIAAQVAAPTSAQAEPEASAHRQPQEQERVTADELRRELATARMELEKARTQTMLAQALAEEQRQLAARERQGNAALQEDARALRDSLDALLRAAGTREENLRRELATASQDIADMQRISANAGTQRALMALKNAEEAAIGLALSQRELLRVKAESMAALDATEASLAATMHALEEERRKVRLAERDLAAAHQSIEQLGASAQLASKKQADLLQSVQLAEAAAKEAGEALQRERERASALALDLETAHREQIVTQQELERVLVSSQQAVDQEREKTVALSRDLASAREEIDALMRRASRRVTKATAVADVGRRPAQRRSEPKSQLPKAITLPNALRPTRPPVEGSLR